MDNRFGNNAGSGVENGGMFTRERLQQITQYSIFYLEK
jgi:hypothetical protein